MNQNTHRLDLAFLAPFGIFAVSATALANAYIAEYGFGLEPCILCLYQRVPYAVAGVLGLAALFVPSLRFRAVAVAATTPPRLPGTSGSAPSSIRSAVR